MEQKIEMEHASGYEVQMETQERVIIFAAATEGVSVEETEKSLDELEELLETAGAETVGRMIQSRDRVTGDLYLGKGKSRRIKGHDCNV